jgi:hypothetical protein
MRIVLNTLGERYPLAGSYELGEREFSGAVDFRISGEHVAEQNLRVRSANARVFHRGNLATTVSFSTRRVLTSHAEAMVYGADLESENERAGEVMFWTEAGSRHLLDAVVSRPSVEVDGCAVRVDYVATGSVVERRLPLAVISSGGGGGLVVSPGGGGTFPEELEDAFGDGIVFRVVNSGGEKWAEFGWLSPVNTLTGDAVTGFLDPTGSLLFKPERSEDLVNWDSDWIPSPGSPVAVGDGDYMYWVRSKYPIDSAVKAGRLSLKSGTLFGDGTFKGDARNNPITGITIAGVVQPLLGVSYTMPQDAAALQARLIALGWTGAAVTASSNLDWEITITDVTLTDYNLSSRVSWPGYPVQNLFTNFITDVNGADFLGFFVNEFGVRTGVIKQFMRMGISRGPNNPF